jgi:hypothetical protein
MDYPGHRMLLRALLMLAGALFVPVASAQQQPCASLKAADGSCVDPKLVAMANRRATIVSSQFTSYLGSPFGSVGMPFIPQERLFRDDTVVFGLPTNKSVTIIDTGVELITKTSRSK